ncbi:unnamed protein product [Adineta steineri]|uniref:Uncharacterized protein n=1 Tax=Adineta steineri TaxID=433720 RepID=A0A814XXB1_9BILA|nr:unnamed protein product [Adineta steineri]CAF4004582.1 unnamed protein product [Adineta steineri]
MLGVALAQTNIISTHVDKFLQQKSDHDWLMAPVTGGKDQFKNNVVYSTFPSNLNRKEFENYVDKTFSGLDKETRLRIKGLYTTNTQISQQEDISFNYDEKKGFFGFGGRKSEISASLIQMVSQRNKEYELELIIGVISLTRTLKDDSTWNRDYWKSDKDRVKRGLQYQFGNEAQKQLPQRKKSWFSFEL